KKNTFLALFISNDKKNDYSAKEKPPNLSGFQESAARAGVQSFNRPFERRRAMHSMAVYTYSYAR
ncbi:hypothetical protein, partial [Niveibacterium sp.]|uniref:hypothetical protein n=1 Tax=Niveibacterium sp. TaxID=2017444 RepID=UPI0035B25A88